MKVLVLAMTIATVSFAAVTAASANIDSRPADTVKPIATGAVQAKPADMSTRGATEKVVAVGQDVSAYGYPSTVEKDEMRAERITVNGKTYEMR